MRAQRVGADTCTLNLIFLNSNTMSIYTIILCGVDYRFVVVVVDVKFILLFSRARASNGRSVLMENR